MTNAIRKQAGMKNNTGAEREPHFRKDAQGGLSEEIFKLSPQPQGSGP